MYLYMQHVLVGVHVQCSRCHVLGAFGSHPTCSLRSTRHFALNPLHLLNRLARLEITRNSNVRIHSGLAIGAATCIFCRWRASRPGTATPRTWVHHGTGRAQHGTTLARARAASRRTPIAFCTHCSTRLGRAHVTTLLVTCATSPALRGCRRFKAGRLCSTRKCPMHLRFDDRSSNLISEVVQIRIALRCLTVNRR